MGCDGTARAVIDTLYKIEAEWNNEDGDYRFYLNQLSEYSNGERRITQVSYGDKAWAKRNANHYGIKLPSTKEIENA